MLRAFAALAIAAGLIVVAAASADPPSITSTGPFGARRGEATEVTFFGTNFNANPRLIAPFSAEVTPIAVDGASWKVRIVPAANTPVGSHVVRIRTDDGLSNPFLFAIGQVAQVAEKEDNGSFETAQVVPLPVVVEGQSAGNDVDFFRFAGKKGQRIVVDAQCARIGSGVDPSIRLSTAAHGFIASADDTPGLSTDARLSAILPEDTDYIVELSDSRYQGGARAVYRLLIGPVPVADEVFPLGGRWGETVGIELRGGTLPGPSVAAATMSPALNSSPHSFQPRLTNHMMGIAGPGEPVLDLESMPPMVVDVHPEYREPLDPAAPPLKAFAPAVFNGRIESKGDVDSFIVGVTPGQKLHIDVAAAELGSALDGVLQVKGPDGAVLANADDTTVPLQAKTAKKGVAINSPDPSLNFTVPAGMTEITLSLRDLRGEGGPGFPYRITVETVANGFTVTPNVDQLNVPKGGTASITVDVVRSGYDGPITLTVAGPPPGLTVRPGLIPPGQVNGSFTVSAAPDASFDLATLKVVGEGKGAGAPMVVLASRPLVFAQQTGMATNVVLQEGLPTSTAMPSLVTLTAPDSPIEIAQGAGGSVPIKATRLPGAEDSVVTFGSMPLPAGLAVGPSNLPAKALEAALVLTATPETPLGTSIIVLNARGNVAGKDRTVTVPAVTITVVRPVVVELSAASVDVKAGTTVELKGKITRKGAFADPVTVKLDALPAGLKAEPVVVPPGQAEFSLKIVAEPTAAVAQATSQVAIALQVAKKDYVTPNTPLAIKILPAQ